MINIALLTREAESHRAAAVTLAEKYHRLAESENRALTKDELDEVNGIAAKARNALNDIAAATADRSWLDSIKAIGTPTLSVPAPARLRSMGEQFVTSEAYEFFRKGGHRTTSAWRSPSVELFAATLTEDPASGGALVVPDYQPGIRPLPSKRLVVADLFAPGTTDSNAISYMQEKVFTNAAAPVAEGAVKPESTLTFEAVTDAVRKIAHWLPVSEEMLEDVAQIRSYIDARLRLGVQIEEEDQLLNGTGVAPEILGIRVRPGLAADVVRDGVAVPPESNADALLRQTMAIFGSSLLMPDGYVINPANWTSVLIGKNAAGDYYTGGPFSPIQTPTLWGLPAAVTPSIPAGVGLVGAFKTGGQVFRKGGIRVEASNSHADYFIKNLVAIRAEERLALAVYRPGAFGEVTGLA